MKLSHTLHRPSETTLLYKVPSLAHTVLATGSGLLSAIFELHAETNIRTKECQERIFSFMSGMI